MSAGEREEGGAVVFFDRQRLQMIRKVGMPGSVSALLWHSRLNQIFAGVGDRKSGACRVLYDTAFSERGVMQARWDSVFCFVYALSCKWRQQRTASEFDLPSVDDRSALPAFCFNRFNFLPTQAVGRQPRKASEFDLELPMVIKNPHSLPLFREGPPIKKRKRDRVSAAAAVAALFAARCVSTSTLSVSHAAETWSTTSMLDWLLHNVTYAAQTSSSAPKHR